MLAARQDHRQRAHLALHRPVSERIEPEPAGAEPARQRAAQVRRICEQRQPGARQFGVDRLQTRAGTDDRDSVRAIDVHAVEARHLEQEATIIRHRAAHRGAAGAARRDPQPMGSRPSECGFDFAMCRGLEHEVRNRARQDAGEHRPEVDVLIAIEFRTHESIGHDAVAQTLQVVSLWMQSIHQCRLQAACQAHGAPRRIGVPRGCALPQHVQEIGDPPAHDCRGAIARQREEFLHGRPEVDVEERGRAAHRRRSRAEAWRNDAQSRAADCKKGTHRRHGRRYSAR